jgi:ribonucleoside-diphosphate reductase beta chain|tara:strand:+ start:7911 stop:8861 length:951 start_codon:yes stop_codon:yes gene_type:complete
MSILITPNPNRFVLYPIQHPELFEFYKKHIASFWTVEEIDMSQDTVDWQKLSEIERDFILSILGFFSASDGIVVENLVTNFCAEVQLPEARAMYSFQAAMENIHSETYSLMIDTLATDQQKGTLFNHIENHPGTKAKAEWAMKYMEAKRGCVTNFSERLVAFACVEGIMFSSSFCAIYWLKNRGLCPGLTFSNELISRDEGLHRDFAVAMYKMCPKLTRKRILVIVQSAVEVEMEFVKHSLPENLKGMNYDMMTQYVKFVADHLLNSLGYNKLYKVKNPFPFMDMISLEGKTNFFERRVGEYSRPTAMSFGMDDAF